LLTAGFVVSLVIFYPMGARGLLSGKLIAAGLTLLVAIFIFRHWLTGGWEWHYARETLQLALPIVPHSLLALGLIVADRLILEHYRPLAEVGIYSLAYTFGMVMYLVTSSLSQAWSPIFYDLARHGDQNKPTLARIVSAVVTVLTIIACFGACISHDFLRYFLDARYRTAAELIPWIIGGYLLHAIFSLMQTSAMQARKSQVMWIMSLIACATNVALNFLWVPKFGMFGAAWATAVAYAIEALLMYLYAQRVFRLSLGGWRIFVDVCIFAGVLWVTQHAANMPMRPLAMLATFSVAALLLSLVAGSDFKRSIWMLVSRRAA
jgi:O-antigen/teichoic acid export membrane protein